MISGKNAEAAVDLPPHLVPIGADVGAASAGVAGAPPVGAARYVLPWRGPLRWIRRGVWAVTDQALFALSNFVLNIALARLLVPQDYGTFTLAYTTFLLIGTVYTSLYIEPLLVFGAGKYHDDVPAYVRALVRFHWFGSAVASVALAAAGLVLHLVGHAEFGASMFALALSNPFILLQWLMRRVCYVRVDPRTAASAGLLYVLLLLVGGYAIERRGWLTAASSIALMGVGSLGSALWIMWRLDLNPFAVHRDHRAPGIVADHWNYGRWVIGGSVLGWVPQSIYYWILPVRGGLESTAALKALMNLIMPVLHAFQPMLILMIPVLVRQVGTAAFARTVRVATTLAALAATAYWLLLGLVSHPLVAWVYKGRYVAHAHLLWVVGLVPITGAGVAVLGSALRARQQPQAIFAAYAMSTLVAATIGVALSAHGNVTGAAVGIALSSLTTLSTMLWYLRRAGAGVPDAGRPGAGAPDLV